MTIHGESPKLRSSRADAALISRDSYSLSCIVHNTFSVSFSESFQANQRRETCSCKKGCKNTLGSSRESAPCNTQESTFFLVIVWQYFNALEKGPVTEWCSCQGQMFFRSCQQGNSIRQSSSSSMDNRLTQHKHHMFGGRRTSSSISNQLWCHHVQWMDECMHMK